MPDDERTENQNMEKDITAKTDDDKTQDNVAISTESNEIAESKTQDTPSVKTPNNADLIMVRQRIMRLGKGESVFRIICSIIVAIVFIGFPHIMGLWGASQPVSVDIVVDTASGAVIPIFNTTTLNSLAWLILIWTIAACVGEVIKMVISRYNKSYALTTTIANVLVVVSTGIVFLNSGILNNGFVETLRHNFQNMPNFVELIARNINIIIFAVIFFALTLEIILTWVKTIRYANIESETKEKTTASSGVTDLPN